MIDWYGLFYNVAWILGLAVVLAALAMASFQARVQGVRLRQRLVTSSFLMPFGVGMSLFCLGVLLSSQTWWEKVLWGLLTVLSVGQVFRLWRDRSGARAGGEPFSSDTDHAGEPVKTTLEERGS